MYNSKMYIDRFVASVQVTIGPADHAFHHSSSEYMPFMESAKIEMMVPETWPSVKQVLWSASEVKQET